jgi:hypothetical protein
MIGHVKKTILNKMLTTTEESSKELYNEVTGFSEPILPSKIPETLPSNSTIIDNQSTVKNIDSEQIIMQEVYVLTPLKKAAGMIILDVWKRFKNRKNFNKLKLLLYNAVLFQHSRILLNMIFRNLA